MNGAYFIVREVEKQICRMDIWRERIVRKAVVMRGIPEKKLDSMDFHRMETHLGQQFG